MKINKDPVFYGVIPFEKVWHSSEKLLWLKRERLQYITGIHVQRVSDQSFYEVHTLNTVELL